MNAPRTAVSATRTRELLHTWNGLSEEEKSTILPKLLMSMQEWKELASDERTLLSWLEWKFEEADLPFLPEA